MNICETLMEPYTRRTIFTLCNHLGLNINNQQHYMYNTCIIIDLLNDTRLWRIKHWPSPYKYDTKNMEKGDSSFYVHPPLIDKFKK